MTLPSTATGVLTIDLAALADNWRLLNGRAAPARAAAVIKANGYGLGIERVAAALFNAGCRMFFVAHPDEGARARAVLSGGDADLRVERPAGARRRGARLRGPRPQTRRWQRRGTRKSSRAITATVRLRSPSRCISTPA